MGAADRAIPPADAERTQAIVPGARVVSMPGLGHLAHEEDPAATAALIVQAAQAEGVAVA